MKKIMGAVFFAIQLALIAQQNPPVISLWPNGAPGFESRKNIPEIAASYWVRNINNPTLTIFLPPKEKANGAAVVICPGGGFRELVYGAEGVDPAKFFNSNGIAAFVLKYRLPRETNSVFTMADAARAQPRAGIWPGHQSHRHDRLFRRRRSGFADKF
jgi:acetyl esterase/lipase